MNTKKEKTVENRDEAEYEPYLSEMDREVIYICDALHHLPIEATSQIFHLVSHIINRKKSFYVLS
jgi:hypothetical protein